MTKDKAQLITRVLSCELNCRIARFERDREDPDKYGAPDPWSCGGTCKYCGIVLRDHELVENVYKEVIDYFAKLSR